VGERRNKKKTKKFLQPDENENTRYQNLCEIAKAVPRGKFIAISANIRKSETSQINNLIMYLKLL
jgi:hypothetical protein